METLAIIAYKQPITKGEVELIRGVNSDYSIQKLLEKELILISGRNESLPGHPLIYNTTKNFMDYFGINTPQDLPKIREVLADQIIQPSLMSELDFKSNTGEEDLSETIIDHPLEPVEDHSSFIINENGEITNTEEDTEDKKQDPE